MPFGSAQSPSVRKMEHGMGGRPRFAFGRVIGDPFSLATVSVAALAFLIAFVSAVISEVRDNDFPNFAWWALAYMFCCIVGVLVTVMSDSVHSYHVAITGYCAAALILNSSSVNSLVYDTQAPKEAAAAGFILLSMVSVVWIFYFGSQPQSSHRAFVDSFALHKDRHSSRQSARSQVYRRQEASISQTAAAPQMYTSAQLNGFETSSPVSGFPGGPIGASDKRMSSQQRFGPTLGAGAAQGSRSQNITPQSSTDAPSAEYPYRARALYSYEANPDDANEISFSKNEILEVSDVSGRWWQAKKENGETGIAPSNYLILL